VRSRGKRLMDLAQNDLDAWLASPPTTRWQVHGFIAWEADTRRIKHVHMPGRRFGQRPHLDGTERVAAMRRLLYDETLRLELRVAGLLVLLLAQPVTRIVRLATSDVEPDPVAIRVGNNRLEIPSPLDALVMRLSQRRAQTPGDSWLFPGRVLGEPVSANALRNALRSIGVPVRVCKNTALGALVAELPAPLVSQAIGIHPSTASRWATQLAADWCGYPARRHASSR
jgi:hypothetical protein